jgi:hypothetical protein
MKRLIMFVISMFVISTGCLALAGCVVVPAHGGYYYHRAVVVAPAPVVVAPVPVIAVRPW